MRRSERALTPNVVNTALASFNSAVSLSGCVGLRSVNAAVHYSHVFIDIIGMYLSLIHI